jgi:hypothetical protein
VGPKAVLDAVVKRKIFSPSRESNLRTPIVQPAAQRCICKYVDVINVFKVEYFFLNRPFIANNLLNYGNSRPPYSVKEGKSLLPADCRQ